MIIHDVEQGTEEWHALRAGKPTASEFSKLVTSTGEPSKQLGDYAIQMAADYIAGEPVDRWQGNEWTERGHEMEDRARASYTLEHPQSEVKQVGFITDEKGTMGASPDSVVDEPNRLTGGLEIKCLKGSNHIKALIYFKKHGRMPTTYVQQTQGQMYVGTMAWNDLYFWHPELPSLTIRTYPDELFIHGGMNAKGKEIVGLAAQLEKCITERDEIIGMLSDMM